MKNLIEKIKSAKLDFVDLSAFLKESNATQNDTCKLAAAIEKLKQSTTKLNSAVAFAVCLSCLHFVLTKDLSHMKLYLKWMDIMP